MRRLSPLPLTLFVAASLLLLGLLTALDPSPTTWANPLDDTLTPTATATDTSLVTDTLTATATATDEATPTPSATVTPTVIGTATATPTFVPSFFRYLPLVSQASGMRLGWRCWPDASGPSCGGPTPTPTATWTPIPTNTPQPTPVVLPRLNSISMVSASDGWVVGAGGSILHWDGQRWGRVASPTTNTLNVVSKVSATDVWAAGDGGTILHWDGVAWRAVPSGTTSPITAIHMVSATDGWAGGAGGFILRWDGRTWYWFASTDGPTPLSIDMFSPTDGWLVGAEALAMHWNGAQWQKMALAGASSYPGPFAGRSVSMVSPTDVWVVGHPSALPPGTTESWGFVFHWDGNQWTGTPGPTRAPLYAINMRTGSDGWAVGYKGHIIHWDGHDWLPYRDLAPYPGPGDSKQAGEIPTWARLLAVAAVSANDAWAVGESGVIIHWNGQTWTPAYSLPTLTPTLTPTATGTETPTATPTPHSPRPNRVSMTSLADGWVVGEDGLILHWDGSTWSTVPSPTTENLTGVVGISGTEAWAVGEGASILRWDGMSWAWNAAAGASLYALTKPSASGMWAVGGSIVQEYVRCVSYRAYSSPRLLHWSEGHWQTISGSGRGPIVKAISVAPNGQVWTIGYNYRFFAYDRACAMWLPSTGSWMSINRWDGSAWQELVSLPDGSLRGIAMPSETDGWAVGAGGLILRWDGQTWSEFPKPTLANLNAIAMLSPTDGWIVGDAGTILHWDGAAWNQVDSPTTANLLDMSPIGPYDGWIVGRDPWNNGVLLRYSLRASPAVTTPTATRTSTPSPTVTLTPTITPSPTVTMTPTITPSPTFTPLPTATLGPLGDEAFTAVTIVSGSEGWAVGNAGTLIRWDGSHWAVVSRSQGDRFLAVSRVSANEVWAAGSQGSIRRWDGNQWHVVDSGVSDEIKLLSMISSTDGWAVAVPEQGGANDSSVILRWDGVSWQRQDVFPGRATAMRMRSATVGWIVGNHEDPMYWDGLRWQLVRPSKRVGIALFYAVYTEGEGELWAVGAPSGALYHWDGYAYMWKLAGSQPPAPLSGARILSPRSVWSTGDVALHWDGHQWAAYSILDPSQWIWSVDGLSETDVWAVGGPALALHWDGQSWTGATILLSPTATPIR